MSQKERKHQTQLHVNAGSVYLREDLLVIRPRPINNGFVGIDISC